MKVLKKNIIIFSCIPISLLGNLDTVPIVFPSQSQELRFPSIAEISIPINRNKGDGTDDQNSNVEKVKGGRHKMGASRKDRPLFSDNDIVYSFMSKLFQETEVGYSIYGEKPIYLGTFCHPEYLIPGSTQHQKSNLNLLALNILKRINNSQLNNEVKCILIGRGNNLLCCHDFMVINREAFRKVMKENMPLFKMKFGKDVSFDRLLADLLSTENGFESLFQGEQALQGIVLGYGQENAISYQRAFPFKQAILSPKPMPPIAIPHIFSGESLIQKQQSQFKKNAQWKKVNEELKDFDCHLLMEPEKNVKVFFSFHKNSMESQKLIESYKKTQCKINHVLLCPNFLNDTLSLFGLDSQLIQKLSKVSINELFTLKKAQASLLLAKTIKFTFDEYITDEFLKGMRDAERINEEEIELYPKKLRFFDIIRKKSLSLEPFKENSAATKEFLKKIAQEKGVSSVLDKYIYIKKVKETQSKKVVTNKTESVFIKYVIRDINGNPIHGTFAFDKAKKFKIENLIPGLAHGLVGMKEGEIREIYIHPEFAYGLSSDFGSGKALQMKIQLVKIENSGDGCNKLPLLQLFTVRGISPKIEICEEFENFRKKYSYACGLNTWLHYKKAKSIVDLAYLIEKLQENTDPLSHNERILISYLNWYIYQMR